MGEQRTPTMLIGALRGGLYPPECHKQAGRYELPPAFLIERHHQQLPAAICAPRIVNPALLRSLCYAGTCYFITTRIRYERTHRKNPRFTISALAPLSHREANPQHPGEDAESAAYPLPLLLRPP